MVDPETARNIGRTEAQIEAAQNQIKGCSSNHQITEQRLVELERRMSDKIEANIREIGETITEIHKKAYADYVKVTDDFKKDVNEVVKKLETKYDSLDSRTRTVEEKVFLHHWLVGSSLGLTVIIGGIVAYISLS